jgi:hypothetical protein
MVIMKANEKKIKSPDGCQSGIDEDLPKSDGGQEQMEAKIKSDLEEMKATESEAVVKHEEVSMEQAAVKPVRGLKKRHGDWHLAVGRRWKPKKRIQGIGMTPTCDRIYTVQCGRQGKPCGTPACISLGVDISPSTETPNFLRERKELISLIRLSVVLRSAKKLRINTDFGGSLTPADARTALVDFLAVCEVSLEICLLRLFTSRMSSSWAVDPTEIMFTVPLCLA